ADLMSNPSPPFRGGREGPIAKRWEGEVGVSRALWSPPPHPGPLRPQGRRGSGPRNLAQRHLVAALGAGPCHDSLIPALDVRVVGEIDLVPLVPPGPPQDREIGDRHLAAGGELRFAQALIEDAVEPARLLRVALQAVAPVFFLLDLQEMVHLARHRPEPTHLPHQPFQHRDLAPQVTLRPELAGLFAEINQDRARFEDADRLPARPLRID